VSWQAIPNFCANALGQAQCLFRAALEEMTGSLEIAFSFL